MSNWNMSHMVNDLFYDLCRIRLWSLLWWNMESITTIIDLT